MQKTKYNLIGLTGQAGCGKDTFAAILTEIDAYHKMAFADPLKNMICSLLEVSRQKLEDRYFKESILPNLRKSPRQLMQTLGTEWGRQQVHPDIWLTLCKNKILRHIENRHVVVTDVRFENEASMIREMGGTIVHIIRPDIQKVQDHVSEAGVFRRVEDIRIFNDRDLGHLKSEAVRLHEVRIWRVKNERSSSNIHTKP